MDGLAAVLPALRGLGVAYQWCCFRPRHPDRRPVIDLVPGLANAWLTSGHFRTGILNAPATAAVLARWIAAGEPPAEPAHLVRVAVRRAARARRVAGRRAADDRRRSSGSRSVTPAGSRYSSSGIAVRRVVPSAWRACAAVNGC